MAVKMRLRREGKKKQPFYRVVVADVRSPRDGRYIEDLGFYQPLHNPSTINIDRERALHWLRTGALPSDAVLKLLRIQGIWEEFRPGDPGKDRSDKNAKREAAKQVKDKAAKTPPKAPEPAPAAKAPAEEAEPAPIAEGEPEAASEASPEAPAEEVPAEASAEPEAAPEEDTAS